MSLFSVLTIIRITTKKTDQIELTSKNKTPKNPPQTHFCWPSKTTTNIANFSPSASQEARCRSCTASTPDGFPLAGVPRGVRAEYAALAQRFRALHAAEATAEVAGTAAAKVAPMEAWLNLW